MGSVLGWLDRYVVDGLINGVGWTTLESGSAMRPLQTGLVRDGTEDCGSIAKQIV